ncbi:hypothetical protein L3X38_010062 [Prunus dulcis]|uniref:Uncharacterized protein n=1 Tax=Prunus dulcis TaxID=3755 RepID=A0AAD4ZCY6_PRUDU|nr:hypothetical protein L3X38_010062 [Prunus dulcis]
MTSHYWLKNRIISLKGVRTNGAGVPKFEPSWIFSSSRPSSARTNPLNIFNKPDSVEGGLFSIRKDYG